MLLLKQSFTINWILLISSFTILNYNLYSLICSFTFFNFSISNSFFYNILYMDYFLNRYDMFHKLDININIALGRPELHSINMLDNFVIYNVMDNIINDISYFLKFISTSSTYCIYFDTKVIGTNSVVFYSLQNKVFIIVGETTLCFFRIINNNNINIYGIPIYIISPFEFSSFITKVQCFCFEEIFIFPYEVVELPVLFFINSKVSSLSYTFINEFSIEYIFFSNIVF